MDIATISAALSSLSITSKFIKDSIEKIKDNAVREKVEELLNAIIPLMSQIISLQALNSASIKEKEALEQKLKNIENWNEEAARYELEELASGVYVYAIKEAAKSSGPVHYLCAKCYNDRKKSILQRTQHSYSGMHYVCHSCSSEIVDHSKAKPIPQQSNNNWDPFT